MIAEGHAIESVHTSSLIRRAAAGQPCLGWRQGRRDSRRP